MKSSSYMQLGKAFLEQQKVAEESNAKMMDRESRDAHLFLLINAGDKLASAIQDVLAADPIDEVDTAALQQRLLGALEVYDAVRGSGDATANVFTIQAADVLAKMIRTAFAPKPNPS